MSFFTTNYSDVNTFEPVPEGVYEAVISEAKPHTFNSGSEGIKITLTIRTDVDQPCGNRKVFENLVKGEKTMFRFQQVAKAVELAEGTNLSTPEAFCKAILFKPVNIKVKHERSIYQGEERINDRVAFFNPAKVPYTGSPAGGPAADPFNIDGAPSTPFPSDNDAPPTPPADSKPPWEQG